MFDLAQCMFPDSATRVTVTHGTVRP